MKVLIIGITGAFGKAIALELLQNQPKGTLTAVSYEGESKSLVALVRNIDAAKKGFSPDLANQIAWIQGDVQNLGDIEKCADVAGFTSSPAPEERQVIVHAVNYPYNMWQPYTRIALDNVIAVSKAKSARILFPANVYSLKPVYDTPLNEDHPLEPPTDKGVLRLEMENSLKSSGVPVLSVRSGDFFGPTLRNPFMQGLFEDPLKKGKAIVFIGSTRVKNDWVFLPALASASVQLLQKTGDKDENGSSYQVFHFCGFINTGDDKVKAIKDALVAKLSLTKPPGVTVIQWWMVWLSGLFDSITMEFYKMKYLKENNLVLDDSKLLKVLPDFKKTSLEDAVKATLDSIA